VLCTFILVYEFFAMLLPQLYDSVVGIVDNFSGYYTSMVEWITDFLADNPAIQEYAIDVFSDGFQMLRDWVTNGLLPNMETIITGLTSSVMSVVNAAFNILVGFCAAIYILCSKDKFMAQGKKVVAAVCKDGTADMIFDLGRRIHKVFSGFIIGKILDSLIIGVMCYIGMLILKLPYPALVATVVGVTNVIPFFGPFIGAIPCSILIFLVNPLQCIYFILFILVLQQFDGNILGPKILGDSTGLDAFWVLFSILLFGGLFGFAGMVLGVPVFAMFYSIVNRLVRYGLKKHDLPVETAQYIGKTKALSDKRVNF
jgi:predicted PurR-regulated permease PerM